MKKILFTLSIILLCLLVVSCDKKNPGGDVNTDVTTDPGYVETTKPDSETGAPTEHILKINPEDYYKCVLFDLPEDFRTAAVDYMRKQSQVEWVCSKTFSTKEQFTHWGINLTYQAGQTYHGLPYSTVSSNIEEFIKHLDSGKYTSDSEKWTETYGNQCVTSILNALQQFWPYGGYSNTFLPSDTNNIFKAKLCGSYKFEKGMITREICASNRPEEMYAAYSLLKPGDVIISWNEAAHTRMVSAEPVLKYRANGELNYRQSYITTLEQTNQFDLSRTDGVKTTWWVDHNYTFEALYNTTYIPVTLEIYEKGISEIPYIALDERVIPEGDSNGYLQGVITSNYPLRYVYMYVYSKSGELVRQHIVNHMDSIYSVNLRNHTFSLGANTLESGDYTLVVTAGIARGEAELQRIDFTIKPT